MRIRLSVLSILCFISFLLSTTASAQTVTGTMQGTVRDATGGVLPGVTVTARSGDTGQSRETVTNDAGFYALPFLPLGAYDVTAVLAGFKTVVREAIDVSLNVTRVVDFELAPAALPKRSWCAPRRRASTPPTARSTDSLNAQEIKDRPTLNPGSFLTLAETFTGFQENPTAGRTIRPRRPARRSISTAPARAARRSRSTASTTTTRRRTRTGRAWRSRRSRSSRSSRTATPRSSAAATAPSCWCRPSRAPTSCTATSTSTTRTARGTPRAPSPLRQTGQLARPVRRHRRLSAPPRTGSSPSPTSTRSGSEGWQTYTRDLFLASELAAPRLTRGNDTPGEPRLHRDRARAFPERRRRTTRAARAPTRPSQPLNQPADDDSLRLDWTPNGGTHADGALPVDAADLRVGGRHRGEQARQNNRQANLGVTWTHVLGPRTVGELRYGLGLRSTNVDIAAGNDTPIVRFAASPVSGSIIGNAGNFPINRDQTDHQFVYNLTRLASASRHQFKTGIDIRLQQLDDLADNFSRGFWNVQQQRVRRRDVFRRRTPRFSTAASRAFRRPTARSSSRTASTNTTSTPRTTGAFDSNLTLNLGVRYEYVEAPSEKEDRIDYGFGDDTNNIEPRLGFAYAPAWTQRAARAAGGRQPGNFSIRGGFGSTTAGLFQSVFSQTGASLRTNPPNALSRARSPRSPGILQSRRSDARLRVRARATDGAPHAHHRGRRRSRCRARGSGTSRVERQMPFNSTMRISYTGTRGVGLIRYDTTNLPVSPLTGPIRVVDHPEQRAGGRLSRSAREGDRSRRRRRPVRRHRPARHHGQRRVPGSPCRSPTTRSASACRAPTSGGRIRATRPTSLVSNTARELVRRPADRVDAPPVATACGSRPATRGACAEDTTSEATVRRRRRQQHPRSRSAVLARLLAASTRRTASRSTAATGCRSCAIVRISSDRCSAAGRSSAVVRLAHGTPFTVTDTTGAPRFELRRVHREPSGARWIRRSSARRSTTRRPRRASSIADKFRSALFGEIYDVIPRNSLFGDGITTVDLGVYKTFRVEVGPRLHRALRGLQRVQRRAVRVPGG